MNQSFILVHRANMNGLRIEVLNQKNVLNVKIFGWIDGRMIGSDRTGCTMVSKEELWKSLHSSHERECETCGKWNHMKTRPPCNKAHECSQNSIVFEDNRRGTEQHWKPVWKR